ncbi:MAG: LamG-like jellyroll fold domain-containing protein, partial [Pseudomonadota bacterium]
MQADQRVVGILGLMMTLVLSPLSPNANAVGLDIDGSGDRSKAQVLYLFNETSGPIRDLAPNGAALNMNVDNGQSANFTRGSGYIQIDGESTAPIATTANPANKIRSACQATNELTVEAWVQPRIEDQRGPARIFSMSVNTAARNFTLGQDYDNGEGNYDFRVRAGGNNNGSGNNVNTSSGLYIEDDPNYQRPPAHLIFTRDAAGTIKLIVNGQIVYDEPSNINQLGGNFNGWDQYRLMIGNELSGDRPWRGRIYLLAVFGEAVSLRDLLPDGAFYEVPKVMPDVDAPFTDIRTTDLELYQRLVGIKISIDAPIIKDMESFIDNDDWMSAAALATEDPGFYNLVVRDYAVKMSNRELTVKAPLNDMAAMFIGVTRDELDARLLLTGDFYYQAGAGYALIPSDTANDMLSSNRHYEMLEAEGYDVSKALVRVNGQKLLSSAGQVIENPNPAGVLTSRAFMAAHATAGTNRRLVEFAFQEFLCSPIEQWADANVSDAFVGRDVDRYPGGSNAKYQTTCKSCHSPMDAMRGAFSRFDFADNLVKYTTFYSVGRDPASVPQMPIGIVEKINHNFDVFPGGHEITDTSWINQTTRG